MRRNLSMFVICLSVMLMLTACGQKDEQEIVSDLTTRMKELSSYESHGKMVIQTGQEPVKYDVEVWFKKPYFYRVALKNEKKNITQILLRNDQGVFVVTPHLKKSFRFQSDWPDRGGQIYLYQTIMSSIVQDQERIFQTADKEYQFDVAAKYTLNANLSKQRIWLDRRLYPKKVHVFDRDQTKMAEVKFDQFKTDISFDRDAFELKRNLSQIPKTTQSAHAQPLSKEGVDAVVPAYVPKGSQLQDEQVIQTSNGPVSILRFAGKNPFTLTVQHPSSIEAGLPVQGEPVLLDRGMGVLLKMDQKKQISWVQDQREYRLIGNFSNEEMIKIANSIFNQTTK